MAISASGQVSFSDLRSEFVGGSSQISMGDLYRGGSNILTKSSDNTATNLAASVPTSGQIVVSDFYGTAKGFKKTFSADATNQTVAAIFGDDEDVNYPKFIDVNSGVTIGGTGSNPALTIGASLAGSLTINNSGSILGKGGAAGSAGGNAINCSASGVVLNNLSGAILAGGGGGGGTGGTGGNGSSQTTGNNSSNGRCGNERWDQNCCQVVRRIYRSGSQIYAQHCGPYNENCGSTVTVGDTTYTRSGGVNSNSSFTECTGSYNYRSYSMTWVTNVATTGGSGGSGGVGQGYSQTNTSGAAGSAGGTNAGTGGTGGAGGTYGNAGSTGATGANGTVSNGSAGTAGGAAGAAVSGTAITINNSGSVYGATA